MAPVSQRRTRTARALAASTATTLLAGTAHTIAGAHAPSLLLLAITIVLSTPLGILLVRPRASVARTVLSVTAAQTVFHVVFTLFAGPVVALPAAVHGHAAHVGVAGPAHTSGAPLAAAHAAASQPAMIAMHVVAGVVTVFLLHFGERLLRSLGRGVWRLLPIPSMPAVPHPRVRASTAARGLLWHPTPSVPADTVSWRGPPSLLAF